MKQFKFKEGDKVKFDDKSGNKGTGYIVGIATSPIVVIGSNWMVKIEESNIDVNIYPFSTVAMFEIFLEKIQ